MIDPFTPFFLLNPPPQNILRIIVVDGDNKISGRARKRSDGEFLHHLIAKRSGRPRLLLLLLLLPFVRSGCLGLEFRMHFFLLLLPPRFRPQMPQQSPALLCASGKVGMIPHKLRRRIEDPATHFVPRLVSVKKRCRILV